jgi:hypothetical protein
MTDFSWKVVSTNEDTGSMLVSIVQGERGFQLNVPLPQVGADITTHIARYVPTPVDASKFAVITPGSTGVGSLASSDPQAVLSSVVQNHLDSQARAMGYDSIFTAVTYADEASVPKFQMEGTALREWRSLVWGAANAILAAVKAGSREVPSAAQLIAELPVFTPVE